MTKLYAAVFDTVSGAVVKLSRASIAQLNVDLFENQTWREIPQDVLTSLDVPDLADLPAHPDLVEPE